ncbi:hypothetical protein AMC87_PC00032 (plasmid) [Rhizobium phaseoli]|uniref:hypothetical protein n=1 Tax=Rhizobium phaseoli TaxID=396 RepID=UPI0007F1057A|nr:hypothetical protein [Rhizobium phaseoli]ANL49735.1 hypothetical protein AMC87_PC00032 [Rhizobium phaseoli]
MTQSNTTNRLHRSMAEGSDLAVVTKFALVSVVLTMFSTPAAAANGLPDFQGATSILAELLKVLLIAVLMEQAFAVIFYWRLYKEFFAGRAVKTLVMVVASLVFVLLSKYDPVSNIIAFAVGKPVDESAKTLTVFLSALIFSGGSAGVNNLLVALGFRQPSVEPKRPEPPTGMAWLSVRVISANQTARYAVGLAESDQLAPAPLLSTLGRRNFWDRLRRVFSSDPMRFPASGGYVVKAGKSYAITLAKIESSDIGQEAISTLIWSWSGSFADRAIADFEVAI